MESTISSSNPDSIISLILSPPIIRSIIKSLPSTTYFPLFKPGESNEINKCYSHMFSFKDNMVYEYRFDNCECTDKCTPHRTKFTGVSICSYKDVIGKLVSKSQEFNNLYLVNIEFSMIISATELTPYVSGESMWLSNMWTLHSELILNVYIMIDVSEFDSIVNYVRLVRNKGNTKHPIIITLNSISQLQREILDTEEIHLFELK